MTENQMVEYIERAIDIIGAGEKDDVFANIMKYLASNQISETSCNKLLDKLYGEDGIEKKKQAEIKRRSLACRERIISGFDSDCLGEVKRFDSTIEDQSSIQGLAVVAIAGLQGLIEETCEWKASGELECYMFEYAQIMQLSLDLKRHIQSNLEQFHNERKEILNRE